MFFAIDPHNGLAIYDQIVRQVMFAVANEAVRPGDMVPSVRELSRQLAVNPNTVARAFRELQQAGVIASVRGTGMEVSANALGRCRDERDRLLRIRLRGVLQEALQSGMTRTAIRGIIDDELRTLSQPGAAAAATATDNEEARS